MTNIDILKIYSSSGFLLLLLSSLLSSSVVNVTIGTSKNHVEEEAERKIQLIDGVNWRGMCK
jgi:hypothetical protein